MHATFKSSLPSTFIINDSAHGAKLKTSSKMQSTATAATDRQTAAALAATPATATSAAAATAATPEATAAVTIVRKCIMHSQTSYNSKAPLCYSLPRK